MSKNQVSLNALKRIRDEQLTRSMIVARPIGYKFSYELALIGKGVDETIKLNEWDLFQVLPAFSNVYSNECIERHNGFSTSMVKMGDLDITIHNIENPDDFKIW